MGRGGFEVGSTPLASVLGLAFSLFVWPLLPFPFVSFNFFDSPFVYFIYGYITK